MIPRLNRWPLSSPSTKHVKSWFFSKCIVVYPMYSMLYTKICIALLMWVTHLIGVSLCKYSIPPEPCTVGVLHLPWANDHGGSLVNVWDLGCLFGKALNFIILWPKHKGGLFCDLKQQIFGLGWIRHQEIFRSSKFDILKPQKRGPLIGGWTFHPSKLLI